MTLNVDRPRTYVDGASRPKVCSVGEANREHWLAHSQLRSLYGLSTRCVTHVILDTRPSLFSACNIENVGVAWGRGYPLPTFQCCVFQRETLKNWEWPGDEANTVYPTYIHDMWCTLLRLTVRSVVHDPFKNENFNTGSS